MNTLNRLNRLLKDTHVSKQISMLTADELQQLHELSKQYAKQQETVIEDIKSVRVK